MVTKKNYTNYNGLDDELLRWQFENSATPAFEGHEVFDPPTGRRHILSDVDGDNVDVKETYAYLSDLEAACDVEVSTRTAVLALVNAGTLQMCKTYSFPITQASGNGNIYLKPIDVDKLGPNGHWHDPAFNDHQPYVAYYDIVSNELQMLHDPILNNTVYEEASIAAFPWDTSTVANNFVQRAVVNYTAGGFTNNNLYSNSTITLTSGNFRRNVVHNSANVTVDGKDFDDNIVHSDATIVASGTGDVENSTFAQGSNFTISNATNFDNSSIGKDANLTQDGGNILNSRFDALSNTVISGGTFNENVVEEDANVNILSASNYENVFGRSTIYNQVGTGYIRYSEIQGTSTFTNGNTNISNVKTSVSSINTTNSTGSIFNSTFERFYGVNMQSIPTLNITDSHFSSYSQISATRAFDLYIYRSQISSASRVLVSAAKELDITYSNLDSYSYAQVTDGKLTLSYANGSSYGYVLNSSTGSNTVSRTTFSDNSYLRFRETADDNLIYQSNFTGASYVDIYGTSSNTRLYYSSATSRGRFIVNDSTSARIYYSSAQANGSVQSLGNTLIHYIYYSSGIANGSIIAANNTASIRIYGCHASAQSILRVQNSTAAGRIYYSSFTAYFYFYVTFTTAMTRSALHGYGRRTETVTNPPANGTYTKNF